MNWIEFPNIGRLEVVQDLKYVGPLKSYQTNMWSNFSHYSLKLKCPKEINLIGLKNQDFKKIFYKFSDKYQSIDFKIISTQIVSQYKEYSVIKVVLENIEHNSMPKELERDLKLSELF